MSVLMFAAFLALLAAVLAIMTDWLFNTLDPWAYKSRPLTLQAKIVRSMLPAGNRVVPTTVSGPSLTQTSALPRISYQNEIRELPFLC